MHDGVEAVLEVDALAQAVGGDEHAALRVRKLVRPRFASGGGSVPVTAATSTFLPSAPRRCSATYSAVGMNRQNTIGL